MNRSQSLLTWTLFVGLAAVLAGPALAQDPAAGEAERPASSAAVLPSLSINDPAPPLAIASWSTGEAVTGLEEGRIYVVEFWATWCGPCLMSMPHLSQLQQQYAGQVTMIGVTDEPPQKVEAFLDLPQSEGKTWRDVIQYRLATDDHRATSDAYMRAAGQSGIPTAFIVGRDGRIEWIGHPMTMDEPLAKIVANEWDRDAALADFRREAAIKALVQQLNGLVRVREWDAALAMIDEAEQRQGSSYRLTALKMSVLRLADRKDELAVVEDRYVEQSWDDAQALNQFAWRLAIGRGERNLAVAHKAAVRGVELTERKDASLLDTLARVCFAQGDLPQAIEWQKLAVAVDQGENPQIAATLKEYEAAATPKEAPEPERD